MSPLAVKLKVTNSPSRLGRGAMQATKNPAEAGLCESTRRIGYAAFFSMKPKATQRTARKVAHSAA